MKKVIKVYSQDFLGNAVRKNAEKKLFAQGYKVDTEEEFKERDWGSTCCLAIVFLPLAFFAKIKKVRVTYISEDIRNTAIKSS